MAEFSTESDCCDVRAGDVELRVSICGDVGVNHDYGAGAGSIVEEVGGGVDDSPVGRTACITEGIEPGFLDGYDVPVLWAGCFEDVLLCIFGFVSVLLPYTEFAREEGGSYNHWTGGMEGLRGC